MEKCKHGVTDGGKEREEETEVDDGTLEETGNRKEVDDVHRCKRVSSSTPRQIEDSRRVLRGVGQPFRQLHIRSDAKDAVSHDDTVRNDLEEVAEEQKTKV